MLAILLLFMASASSQNVPKVATYKGYEFSFYTNEANGKLTYDDAKQVCVDNGARLAEIKSADAQGFITTQLTDLGLVESWKNWAQGYWVGGVCGGDMDNWKWENGTNIGGSNYENWFIGCGITEPNENGVSSRVYVYPFKEGYYDIQTCTGTLGTWGDDDKSSMKNWICMKSPKVATYKGYEFSFNTNEASGKLTYDDAKQVCVDAGARLADIKSADVQDFITTQLTDLGLVENWSNWNQGYWIGGACEGEGNPAGINRWKWEDGTSIGGSNYENWYVGCGITEPNSNFASSRAYVYPFKSSFKGCVGILGTWGDDEKSTTKKWICMKDLCYPNPCENGGTCIHAPDGYQCNCADGFVEDNCATDLCAPNPCQHNGTCVPQAGSYSCLCANGVVGSNCEIDLCDPNPCENGGTCNHASGGYQCNCADGFIGYDCHMGLCDSNPCKNGGTCNYAPGGYQCNCADGFVGGECQTGIPLISVDGVPIFSLVITRNQTQSLNLSCGVNQQFDVSTSFIWMKNKGIKSGSNSLTIDNLGSADLGLYSCISNETFGSLATTVYLDVHYPPEQFKVTNAVNNECEWDLDGVQSCTILFQLNPPTHNATLTKDGSIVSNDFKYLPQKTRNQQFIFRKNQPMKKDAGLYQLTITSAKFDPVIYEFTIDLIASPKDNTATIVGALLGSIIAICFIIIAYLLFDRIRNKNVKSSQCKTRNKNVKPTQCSTRNEGKLNVALSDDYHEIVGPKPGTSTQDIQTTSSDNHLYEKMSPKPPTESVYQNQI